MSVCGHVPIQLFIGQFAQPMLLLARLCLSLFLSWNEVSGRRVCSPWTFSFLCCNTASPLLCFLFEKSTSGAVWELQRDLFLLWRETRRHIGHVVKISSATWEYFLTCFTPSLLTYVCGLIRTPLYPLAESLRFWELFPSEQLYPVFCIMQ